MKWQNGEFLLLVSKFTPTMHAPLTWMVKAV